MMYQYFESIYFKCCYFFHKGLSETPDLLRRPTGNELLPEAEDAAVAKILHQLHLRAVRSYAKHHSQVVY